MLIAIQRIEWGGKLEKQKPVKSYIDEQIKLEEQYYDKLHAILSILILRLNDYMGSEQSKTLIGLNNIFDIFCQQSHNSIYRLNNSYALAIVNLSYNTVSDSNRSILNLNTHYIYELNYELTTKIRNLLLTIKGRYIAMIPVGSRQNTFPLFTDDNSKDQLIHRNNLSILRLAQMVISEAVFNAIVNDLKNIGATEYLGENQHDGRVRETHMKYFNGQNWIRFDTAPSCGHIATEAGCRCFIIGYR